MMAQAYNLIKRLDPVGVLQARSCCALRSFSAFALRAEEGERGTDKPVYNNMSQSDLHHADRLLADSITWSQALPTVLQPGYSATAMHHV